MSHKKVGHLSFFSYLCKRLSALNSTDYARHCDVRFPCTTTNNGGNLIFLISQPDPIPSPSHMKSIKSGICAAIALLAASTVTAAVTPDNYCAHRFDSFKGMPLNEQSIVFVGNSITNMGCWAEFFGDDPRIVNRGNSGCDSNEWLDECESLLADKPAKIFIMLGTNDIGRATGTPESVARNARALIERAAIESPATQIHIVSTFPSTVGARTVENHAEINRRLKEVCRATRTVFIDLWDDMQGITDLSLSKDALHVNARGYAIWAAAVRPYLGSDVTVSLNANLSNAVLDPWNGGQTGAYAMRQSLFSALPVKNGDVLIIGDEFIQAAEWAELLGSGRVKNRGTGWGNETGQGSERTIDNFIASMPGILAGTNAPKACPEHVILGLSRKSILSNMSAADYKAKMTELVRLVRNNAADAKISLLSCVPARVNSRNLTALPAAQAALADAYNSALQEIAASESCGYIDITTVLRADGNLNGCDYVTAAGYNALASVLAPHIGPDCEPVNADDFAAHYALITARQRAGRILNETNLCGTSTGTVNAAIVAPVRRQMLDLLASDADADQINEAVDGVDLASICKLNDPTGGQYYTITSVRNSRTVNMTSPTSVAAAQSADTRFDLASFQWQFTKRADGSWNVVNREYGAYLTANNGIKTSTSEPAEGWNLANHNSPGKYVLTMKGGHQLHQANAANQWNLLDWGYSAAANTFNLTDEGCAFTIAEAPELSEPGEPQPGETFTTPQGSTAQKVICFTFTDSRNNTKVSEATAGNWVLGSTSAGDYAKWILLNREDDTFDIQNYASGHYIDPLNTTLAGNQNQFLTTDNKPENGWKFTASGSFFVITSGADIQMHTANSPYRVLNWHAAGSFPTTSDGGCLYTLHGETEPDATLPVAPSEIIFDQQSLTLTVGGHAYLTATVKPDDATDASISWTTSDENVAVADALGRVTATGKGTAVITASCGTAGATCTVTVNESGQDSYQTVCIESAADSTDTAFDLFGRPVTPARKGIIIMNGRKFLRR